jgi:CarD family transcriptional regulator
VGFKVGQKVVYPNHGIGTIEQIEQKQIGASTLPFYTLRLAANNSLVLVPVSNASEVGLRSPISSGECEMLFKLLADDFSFPANDWKDRFKEFSEKMRTGDVFEAADVLKHRTCRGLPPTRMQHRTARGGSIDPRLCETRSPSSARSRRCGYSRPLTAHTVKSL